MHTHIAIIGAGPAGMTAALHAVRSGAQVTLLDANAVVGRKLLVTGSGRANLTNRGVQASAYTCADPAWMERLLANFGREDLLAFLESLGVLTRSTADGWYYPVSDSAQSVVAAFDAALRCSGVRLLLEHQITAMRKSEKGFTLMIDGREDLTCEKLVVAAGGKAYPTLGSRGELFPSLQALGHTVLPLVPALAPVTCDMRPYQKLQGVRLDARVSLVGADGIRPIKPVAQTTGNLIFTQWGLNGPAMMDLSHLIARKPEVQFELRLNFLPENEKEVRALVERRRNDPMPLAVFPGSSLPPKLTAFLLAKAGLQPDSTLKDTSNAQLETLFELITALPLTVTGVRGFEYCQISAGGVPVTEVDPASMQSRLVPGLYLAGETLDVVGPCGGYNLQFAFSSGAAAGMNC